MRFILTLTLFLLTTSHALANNENYLEMDIPTIAGAQEISDIKNDKFFSRYVTYRVTLADFDQIYDFYSTFFKEKGWNNSAERFAIKLGDKKWPSTSSNISEDGQATLSFANSWEYKEIPVNATVMLIADSYENEQFNAKVSVTIAPNIIDFEFTDSLHKIMDDPKSIFILRQAFGKNPFDPSEINLEAIPQEYKNDPIVTEYKKALIAREEKYQTFGAQYVLRTQPVDGSFDIEKLFPQRAKTKKPEKAERKDAAAIAPCKTGEKKADEDPLHRWRVLQEQQEEKNCKPSACPTPTLWECIWGQQ